MPRHAPLVAVQIFGERLRAAMCAALDLIRARQGAELQ